MTQTRGTDETDFYIITRYSTRAPQNHSGLYTLTHRSHTKHTHHTKEKAQSST